MLTKALIKVSTVQKSIHELYSYLAITNCVGNVLFYDELVCLDDLLIADVDKTKVTYYGHRQIPDLLLDELDALVDPQTVILNLDTEKIIFSSVLHVGSITHWGSYPWCLTYSENRKNGAGVLFNLISKTGVNGVFFSNPSYKQSVVVPAILNNEVKRLHLDPQDVPSPLAIKFLLEHISRTYGIKTFYEDGYIDILLKGTPGFTREIAVGKKFDKVVDKVVEDISTSPSSAIVPVGNVRVIDEKKVGNGTTLDEFLNKETIAEFSTVGYYLTLTSRALPIPTSENSTLYLYPEFIRANWTDLYIHLKSTTMTPRVQKMAEQYLESQAKNKKVRVFIILDPEVK